MFAAPSTPLRAPLCSVLLIPACFSAYPFQSSLCALPLRPLRATLNPSSTSSRTQFLFQLLQRNTFCFRHFRQYPNQLQHHHRSKESENNPGFIS